MRRRRMQTCRPADLLRPSRPTRPRTRTTYERFVEQRSPDNERDLEEHVERLLFEFEMERARLRRRLAELDESEADVLRIYAS